MLEADRVHLIPSAGDSFLAHISSGIGVLLGSAAETDDVTLVDAFIPLDSGDSDSSDDNDDVSVKKGDRLGAILRIVTSNSRKLSSVKPLKDSVARLVETSQDFERQVRLRRQRDNYVFARLKEDADSELNRSRENRVVISGLDRASTSATSHQAKKDHYLAVVTGLILKACPELNPKPIVEEVFVNLRRDQANPSIEAKFNSVSGALAFRKSAASLAKAQDPDFAKLFFANSVTQATRVRIEIMRAIAKKLTTSTEKAFVQGFLSRPVLRYLSEVEGESLASGTGRSYSFVDAVSRFGDLVTDGDLASAYKRAGMTFQGAMEQYFILLTELEDRSVVTGSNQLPVSKRGGRQGPVPRIIRGSRGTRGFSPRLRGGRGQKRLFESPQDSPSKKKSTGAPSSRNENE